MPTTRESVCCSEIGQLWQKVEERGSETQISCITEYPGLVNLPRFLDAGDGLLRVQAAVRHRESHRKRVS